MEKIYVGFAEKPEDNFDFLTNKIGGKPVWLIPKNIPTYKDLLCGRCEKAMSFLLQIYAPLIQVNKSSFHRVIYVFCCQDGDCIKVHPEKSYRVLRAQLPKENPYYSEACKANSGDDDDGDDEGENETYSKLVTEHRLCRISGLYSLLNCSSCHCVYYSNSSFQKEDWGKRHKKECSILKQLATKDRPLEELLKKANIKENNSVQFPYIFEEFEMVTEEAKSNNQVDPGIENCNSEEDDDESDDAENIEKNQLLINHHMENTKKFLSEKFIEEDFKTNAVVSDDYYNYYMSVIQDESDQVFRYYEKRGIEPLWYSKNGRTNKENIPNCQYCGGARVCEFQILSQILYFLKIEKYEHPIDWATLVVYTCINSCDSSITYSNEYIYQQNQDTKIIEESNDKEGAIVVKK